MSDQLLNELRSINEQKARVIEEMNKLDVKWGNGVGDAESMRAFADSVVLDADKYEELNALNDDLSGQMENIMDELGVHESELDPEYVSNY